MKLHKKFIDELGLSRRILVGDVIKRLNILTFEGNSIKNLNENIGQLDEIFYTVDYLIKNELVNEEAEYLRSYVPDFDPTNFIKDKDEDPFRSSRIHAIPRYLQIYWGKELLVLPEYFKMVENGYKTDKEKKEYWMFWLPIMIAIISAILTGLFTKLFDLWLHC